MIHNDDISGDDDDDQFCRGGGGDDDDVDVNNDVDGDDAIDKRQFFL